MVVQFLEALGLTDVSLNLNSLGDEACRPVYQAKLVEHLRAHRERAVRRLPGAAGCATRCGCSTARTERCQEIASAAPNILEFLCEPCRAHFAEVQRKLDALGIRYVVNPRIVRGLDYYTRTTFEFIASHPALGTASTVGGGGRYDKLVKSLGGPDVPAVGFGLGLDRLCLLLKESGQQFSQPADLFVAVADEGSADAAFVLASTLRREGLRVEFDTRGGSLKSQMKRADKVGARYTLVLGQNERESGKAQLKPMAGGEPLAVELAHVARTLREALSRSSTPSAS